MIDFANAKKIVIPQGEVSIIARGSEILWRKQKYKQELEYLESTGTQYIDTGINADANLGFEMTYKINSLANTENRWGAIRQKGSSYIRHHSSMDTAQGQLRYYFNAGDKGYLPTDLNKHTVSLDVDECTLTVDGVANSFEKEVFDCQLNYWLFGRNGNTTSLTNRSKMTIYKCQLRTKGVLVRDFIPVLDMDDVPCLYDKVTDTCFYNKGTGQFKFGYKFEDEYQVLDYIEMNGKQYIDTEYKGHTTKTRYETKIVPSDVTTTQGLFGSRNTVNVSNDDNCLIFIIGGNLRLDWVNGDGRVPVNVAATANTPYEINITRGKATVNGTQYTHTNSKQVAQSHNFLIGNFTNGSSATYSNGFMGKLYYSKLYENDTLIRDFIPCLRKADGKVGMYDKITQQFFTNKGTGEFLYK